MSPADPRALREHFSVYLCGIQYPPKKHLEISSFDTTVRRRPDRSRPPQVGPTGHTCTASADRTEFAKHFQASPHRLSGLHSPLRPCSAHNLPVHPVLPIRRSREAESGGRGGNYFPRMPFLPFLPFLPLKKSPRSSGFLSGAGALGAGLVSRMATAARVESVGRADAPSDGSHAGTRPACPPLLPEWRCAADRRYGSGRAFSS